MGWARADGELRAEPPWDRIDRNRGAGRLARRGVRHETRDASGDMRPRDVRQVAAFSSLTSHALPTTWVGPTGPPGRPERRGEPAQSRVDRNRACHRFLARAARGQARHGGLGGLGGPALPLDLNPHSKEAAEEPTTCAWLRPTWWPLWHTSLRLRSQNGTTGTTKTTETARVDRDGRFGPPRPPSAKLTPPPGRRRRSLRAGTRA